MQTVGVKYIGSKNSLLEGILASITNRLGPGPHRIIDAFTGTTRVAQACRTKGWHVESTDLSWASEAYAHAFLLRTPTSGARIPALLKMLQVAGSEVDWLTRTYCDVSGVQGGLVRMWRPENGQRADAIRNTIASWETSGMISHHEAMILVACLILALDRVDNSVGVQQAYLKQWAKRTEDPLTLEDLPFPNGPVGRHTVANCLTHTYEPADVAYLDPPYSAHSYSTYYHIWDSITRWDKPPVSLQTNRRIDRVSGAAEFDPAMVSPWNSKRAALTAFLELVGRLPVKHVLISYNDESLVPLAMLVKTLKEVYGDGAVTVDTIPYTRNIMSQIGNAALYTTEHKTTNNEVFIWVVKEA